MNAAESGRISGMPKCLARSVIDALGAEPSLEAVTVNREQHKISVATLGRAADAPRVAETVSQRLQTVFETSAETGCLLLQSRSPDRGCEACDEPLSGQELKRISIRNEGNVTTIARVRCPTAPKFWRWRELPWPRVVQRDVEFLEEAEDIEHHVAEWKPQLAAAIVCGVLGVTGWLLPAPWKIAAFAAAYVAGGFYPAQEALERLRQRAIDVHFLMLFVAGIAAWLNAWGEGATLLFLFSFSSALEHFALGRTQKEIRSLFREAPKTAAVVGEDGREREAPVEQLRPGWRLLARPGAQFPVDAEIVKGRTAADESNLTGEATPVEKAVGDTVLAGTINLWGAVEAVVLRPASESALQKIIRLIREAQHQKAPAQRFTDRFSAIYTWFVLAMFVVMYFAWWLIFGLAPGRAAVEMHSALYRAGTLLVVASPCALVLSIPSAVLAAIAWGARHGVLFRGGAAVEKLAETDVVALDKTGTLTTGDLKVERVESFPAGRENEIARLACSLEKLSAHPLARAITRYGKQQGIAAVELEHFESVTGQGLRGQWNGKMCLLGRRDWLSEAVHQPLPFAEGRGAGAPALVESAGVGESPDSRREILPTMPPAGSGVSEICIVCGDLSGRILLRDDVRPQSLHVIEELRAERLTTLVLTGDRQAAARHLQEQLHLDDVRAELKPEGKVAAIRALAGEGRRVAMIGDGVNDAPSLAAAHVGVAMGARGSDAALEQADVVLMHDRLENFLAAFRLSRRARRIIRQNLVISLGTVVTLVTFALLGKIPLTIGVVGHEGSTVVVVMNSLRLLFGEFIQPRLKHG